MNTEYKFFHGIVGQYAEEPDTDEWWREAEVEAALEQAGRQMREEARRLRERMLQTINTETNIYEYDTRRS